MALREPARLYSIYFSLLHMKPDHKRRAVKTRLVVHAIKQFGVHCHALSHVTLMAACHVSMTSQLCGRGRPPQRVHAPSV